MSLNLCAQWLLQRVIPQCSPGINLAPKPLAMNLDCLEKFFGWQPQWSAVTAGCLHTWVPQPVRLKETALLLTCSACNTIGYGAFVYLNLKKKKKQQKKYQNQEQCITLELQSGAVLFHLSYWKLNYIFHKWYNAAISTVLWCGNLYNVQSFPDMCHTCSAGDPRI